MKGILKRALSKRDDMKVAPRSAGRFEELGIGSKEYSKLLKVFTEFDINEDGKLVRVFFFNVFLPPTQIDMFDRI
jgi:hypothetical protein